MTTLAFEPVGHGSFVARLEVSRGWLVTSVLDERGRRLVEHVSAPVLQLEERLHAGRVVVSVRRVTGREGQGTGALEVSFVGPSGAVLPGSGSYALR